MSVVASSHTAVSHDNATSAIGGKSSTFHSAGSGMTGGVVGSGDARSVGSVSSALEKQAAMYEADMERLRVPALESQRKSLSEQQASEFATLAVCAKIERAYARRLSKQDADLPSLRPRQPSEKSIHTGSNSTPTQPHPTL
ncbi:hypothetical protein PYCC9005_000942 [Savitreella phatthalungensis]